MSTNWGLGPVDRLSKDSLELGNGEDEEVKVEKKEKKKTTSKNRTKDLEIIYADIGARLVLLKEFDKRGGKECGSVFLLILCVGHTNHEIKMIFTVSRPRYSSASIMDA